MQITTAKLKNADGSFEYLGIGADANYITLKNGENFEEAASEVNNNTSNMDLTYQILDEELKTSIPVDVELNRNIAEFSSRDPQTNVIKTNKAKVKNEDGWSEDIPIAAAAVNIDLNNGNNAEDTFENLEVKLNKLNEKYDELKSLVSTVVEGDPVTVDSSGMDYIDTIIYGNSYQQQYQGSNILNFDIEQNEKVAVNDDGTITINGTGGFSINFKETILKAGITYYQKIELVSGSISGRDIGLTFMGFDNSRWIPQNFFISYTPNEDISRLGVWVHANAVFDNAVIKIWANTDQSDFEPYVGGTASPNPEFPQDIEVINGVNIFNSELELGTIDANGYKGESTIRVRSDFNEIEPNIKYTISSSNNTLNIVPYYYDKNGLFISFDNGWKEMPFIFTTPSNCYKVKFLFKNSDDTIEVKDVTELQLIKGTELKPYLPYGYIGLEQSGKNKYYIPNSNSNNFAGLDITYIENTSEININGTATSDFGSAFSINSIWLKKGVYSISAVGLNVLSSDLDRVYLRNEDKSTVIVNNITSNITKSFTLDEDANVKVYFVVKGGSIYSNQKIKIQIEEGSIVTPYEPYHEPKVIPINLNGNSIAKVEDTVRDKLRIYRSGKIELIKNVRKVVLDGIVNNFISKSGQAGNCYRINTEDSILGESLNKVPSILSNQFIPVSWNERVNYLDNSVIFRYTNDTNYTFRFGSNSSITNLNLANDYLKQQYEASTPVELFYPLAEPQTVELPSIEPIEPWEGTNIFKLITNLDTTMQVDYYKNYEKYVISNIDF